MKNARILLIEDETDVMQANAQYLEDKGYEICRAETLEEAWNSIWEHPPDLVLLDIMLPDGSGYDFCRELRKSYKVPVIFLTAIAEEEYIINGLRIGADDYIVKPYSLEVLGARVAAHLRRQELGAKHIDLPPLHIDITAGIVRLDEREISLSRREFQLLLYLVENQGRELSQSRLFQAVWSGEEDKMGSTVRVAISRLRQKLSLGEDSCFEISASGNGYIFLRTKYPRGL